MQLLQNIVSAIISFLILFPSPLLAASDIQFFGVSAEKIASDPKLLGIKILSPTPIEKTTILAVNSKGGIVTTTDAADQDPVDSPVVDGKKLLVSIFDAAEISTKDEIVSLSGIIKSSHDITLEASDRFEIDKWTVFRTSGKISLIFSNPDSLIQRIILPPNPETFVTAKPTEPELLFGSIWGKFSCVPTETSVIHTAGYPTIIVLFNKEAVGKLLGK